MVFAFFRTFCPAAILQIREKMEMLGTGTEAVDCLIVSSKKAVHLRRPLKQPKAQISSSDAPRERR